MGDAASLFEYAAQEEVALPAGFLSPASLLKTKEGIRRARAEWAKKGLKRMAFSIIRRRGKVWIGAINLRWPHGGLGEIGYGIRPRFWGQGYATEAVRRIIALAFDELGAHRVQATCWVRNARSARVLLNAGLRKEGRLRGYLKRGDVVRDELMFGMTRVDWKRPRLRARLRRRPGQA